MKNTMQKNGIMIILCSTIICMAIGFTCVSMQLKKKNQDQERFDVSFTKITEQTKVKGGSKEPTGTTSITNRNKTVNIEFSLNEPRDELGYTMIIKNTGTIKAEIINIMTTPDYIHNSKEQEIIDPVMINQNDIIGKILEPNEEIKLKITAIYKIGKTTTAKKIPYQITLIAATPEQE